MDRHTEKRQPHRLMLFAMSVIACVVWYVQLGTNFNCLPAQQAAEEFSKLSISRFLMLYKRFVLNNPLGTVLGIAGKAAVHTHLSAEFASQGDSISRIRMPLNVFLCHKAVLFFVKKQTLCQGQTHARVESFLGIRNKVR